MTTEGIKIATVDLYKSQVLTEELFDAKLPDWNVLSESAERTKRHKQPFGTVTWKEKDVVVSARGLKKGEMWQEYNNYPEQWGGSYPIGLDTIPVEIEKLKDEIESLKRIIKSIL